MPITESIWLGWLQATKCPNKSIRLIFAHTVLLEYFQVYEACLPIVSLAQETARKLTSVMMTLVLPVFKPTVGSEDLPFPRVLTFL